MTEKKTIVLATAMLLVAVIVFWVFFEDKGTRNANNPVNSIATTGENALAVGKNTLLLQREMYGFPLAVFEELPVPPRDFERLVALMHKGTYTNFAFFGKEYFLQPEFYAGFKDNGFGYWLSPSLTHYGVQGYGVYPDIQNITIAKGETATAVFFVRAGWGVQNFQGAKIVQSKNVQGIDVVISEPEFLIGYSYPKFSDTWVKKMEAIISVGKKLPAGNYVLEFTPTNPSSESKAKWLAQGLNRSYYDIQNSNVELTAKINLTVIDFGS